MLAVELSEVALAACTLHGLAQSFLRVQICMFSFAASFAVRAERAGGARLGRALLVVIR